LLSGSWDRLWRSLSYLVGVLAGLQGKGIAFLSLTEAIGTESAAGAARGGIRAGFDVGRTQAG